VVCEEVRGWEGNDLRGLREIVDLRGGALTVAFQDEADTLSFM